MVAVAVATNPCSSRRHPLVPTRRGVFCLTRRASGFLPHVVHPLNCLNCASCPEPIPSWQRPLILKPDPHPLAVEFYASEMTRLSPMRFHSSVSARLALHGGMRHQDTKPPQGQHQSQIWAELYSTHVPRNRNLVSSARKATRFSRLFATLTAIHSCSP